MTSRACGTGIDAVLDWCRRSEQTSDVDNIVVRAREMAQRAAEYDARVPPPVGRYRRSTDPPCAVVAIARHDGVSYELVRRLLNAHRRIPADLLDALLPHRPSLTHVAELSRLSEERQRRVVARVVSGEMRLGPSLREETR